ncbi:MAG: NBR1-Ig-like domain-containing protein [Acidobacteria bacterium]|nr:NBR1-Ig-like domain-containing protein [Acidobacteriota bacterium]
MSPASLSFTAADYSTSQTVTVTGVQDDDADNESATVSLSASGGDYANVSSSVSVTVTDDDTQGLVLSATDLSVAEGGNGTFTVALSTQPTGAVTVSVSSGDTGAATVSPASLSFTAADYSTSQTVTVTGVQDDDASNESPSISLAASGGGYVNVSSSVSVTVTDDDTPGLVLSTTQLSVAEGGTGTFTVALSTQPTGTVTVTVTSGDTGAATVSPASLSFTAADYGTPQTVTVTGVQDDDADNESTTVSLSASGGDYGNVSSSVSVTVTDDDTQGLALSATDLSVAEGGNGTFTVALSTQPTGAVTVSVSSGDTGAATVSPASLSFTAADYSTSQTVTVAGVQDDDSSNESTTVSLSASGGGYDNVSSSVSVTVTDDDTQGLVLSATDLGVAEGGTGTFTVALSTQPTGAVTVAISSGDTGAATASPASLSFTVADYGTSQTVTIAGVQDDDADNESTTVSLSASGGDYGNVSSSVSVTVADDDSETPSPPAGTPSFGTSTILDQTWVKDTAISSLTLPAAAEGDGDLTYSLTGTLPAGVTFNASTRTLSGTPTKKQAATAHTYTATDEDGDAASLSFTIRVANEASDGASFVSYVSVPSTMGAGSSTTVTVRMRNDGTTTWTSAANYKLGSQRPQDNVTWGLNRASLATAVPPNATADFAFTITAPAKVGSYKFRWRMVRGTDGWFGDKTELRLITVEADESPSFGASTIHSQTWVKNTAISSLTLPAATGGNGDLTYALAGTLPKGVTFDASTRTLSGTPTKKQEATQYTYTATDEDGDAASLSFTIRVAAQASDDASFVSYMGVPSTMAAGSSASVTVRMRNDGTTTWTSMADYKLGSQRPEDNTTWGLSRVSLPSDVVPNAAADFTFTITAPTKLGSYKFRWRMVRGTGDWFGDKTELKEIEVEADESPSFGTSTILDQTWVKNTAIAALTLPAATGGNGDLTYSLTGTLPAGVTFDASTRTLSGTPTKKQEATEYTYTVMDSDGDTASLSFTIRVAAQASDDASFVSYADVPSRIAAGSSATVTVRMRNEGTTTWTSSADYELGSQRPEDNTTWGLSRASLSSDVAPNATADFTFTITAPEKVGSYKFRWRMVRGTAGWFGDKTESRTITVEDPSFGDETIDDQAWVKNTPIEALTLPAASGGDGALTYTLAPALPTGVTFTESTRIVSGTPTAVQAKTAYTYKATDSDGDAATISFEIGVAAAPADNAAFVSSSGVPSKIVAGGTATVTVTMKNTGSTTWTSSADYELGSQIPSDNTTWGLSRVSVPSAVAPNGTAAFTFTITAPATTGSYTFAWRMVKDTAWFGAGTGSVTITVEDPSFGDATIADQTWVRDTAIAALTLPAASGGDGALTYALTPSLPDGVTFTESTRTLSGTPTVLQAATKYTYTATDTDGDAATISFEIGVAATAADDAVFVSSSGVPSKMVAGGTATVTVTMKNTGSTTWTSSADYELGSQTPNDNETWGLSRVSLPSDVAPNATAAFTFTITAPDTTGSYVFAWRMVKDAAWFGAGTASVTITVEDPSFGDTTVANQTWVKDTAISALVLPAASGGDGTLTYTLTPSPPAGVTFTESTRALSGTPTEVQAKTDYTYTATDEDGDTATLSFAITVNQAAASSSSSAASALPPPAPTGVFDMFEYWLLPRGSAVKLQARLQDGRIAPASGSAWLRSFWRGELWGRKLALLGDPRDERYDIFEVVEDGLDYWGTFEGAAAGDEVRPSVSLDRPFRWMNRFMGVGDVVESPVTGRLLSSRRRNQEGMLEARMRLKVVAHHASFEVPAVDGLAFEDVLEVRFWSDAGQAEVHDTFFLAPGYGAVYSRRSEVAAAGGVVEWWAVEKTLTPVVPSAPSVPWFDPFSPGWPKTAVLNGNMDDFAQGVEGGQVGSYEVPGWTADSSDALIARPPSGLDAGSWSMLLRGSDGGGDNAPDVALTEDWIPVEGGTYQLSACMRRESAADNVLVDFDDGKGRDADFADAHLVATSTGSWECRAVTKCIPGSVGAVRIRAVRDGANLGDAWFDRIELKRIAACTEQPGISPP